jgi:hypothetical protein
MNAVSIIILLLTIGFAVASIIYIVRVNKEFNNKMMDIRAQATTKLSMMQATPAPQILSNLAPSPAPFGLV